MQTVTQEKLVNVFGEQALNKFKRLAKQRKGVWIQRFCNTLYFIKWNDADKPFYTYSRQRNAKNIDKFHDWAIRPENMKLKNRKNTQPEVRENASENPAEIQ